MKIAYVITRSDTIGGAQVHVQYLAKAFLEKGHIVKVFVGGSGPFINLLKKENIPVGKLSHLVQPINPIEDIKAYNELKDKLYEYSPDLITLHSSKAGWIGRLAGKKLEIPILFTAHGWAFTEGKSMIKRGMFLAAEKMVGSIADRIITVSDFDKKLALKYKITGNEKLVTIHNGVHDINEGFIATINKQKPKIIMVARFDHQKNQAALLQGLAQIKELEWTLEFIGEGPLESNVKKITRDLGLIGRVNFLGYRDDVEERLTKAEIFCLITNWEGLPISIIEAIRASLPVVATDVSGVNEIIKDKKNGFLIRDNEPEKIANKIKKLIQDCELRKQMGEKGRELFLDKFTYKQMHKKTLKVYYSVINTNDI
jgi:glycosyltransferase involved in cell wall biosynthesis